MPDTEPKFVVDLSNCEREPIHIPCLIQPFGFLLATTADGMIARVSENVADFLDRPPGDLLGLALKDIFLPEAIHAIRNRITMLRGPDAVERLFGVQLTPEGRLFDLAIHFSGSTVVIEAEPASPDTADQAGQVRALLSRLGQTESLMGFLRESARQVRAITGFDRVMVYRFDETGSGEVVAESLRSGVDSFLGLNYPASDIPPQARRLYQRNIFRIIADVDARPAAIVPTLDGSGQPLDQSLSLLRAVSPIHIEYLRNMGVRASLSISIVVGGRLWGLFACHHYSPLLPSFAQRSAAELYGYMFSLMLESRERRELADYERRARGIADRLMAAVAQDAGLLVQASWIGDMTLEAIPADGVGVFVNGSMSLSGLTPKAAEFEQILHVLNRQSAGDVFATDCLADLVPEAARYAHVAAGMLSIPISRSPRDYIVLFRSERLRTVRWAGNPEKAVEFGPNGSRLTPRKSFEEWSELVRGKALPFSAVEINVARTVRTALLEVVLQLSEEANEERRRAQEQQLLLIAELNHRVRNILALIRGLVSQSRRDQAMDENFVETLDLRVQALARAHDQITAHRWGPGRLIELIEAEAGAYLGTKRERLVMEGPDVLIDPTAFTVLALLFHELITNAAKYGALSDNGTVRVSWRLDRDGSMLLDWVETGGPPVKPRTRRGFGSTIIERSIPFELNGRAEVNFKLGGLEAAFCVPSRFVAGLASSEARARAPEGGTSVADSRLLAGRSVLLAEDSMLVALDAEDALRALGATDIVVVSSITAALEALDRRIDVAVLDYNLGVESSLPVAERLLGRGAPFVFATGYGEGLEAPASMKFVPVVTKPYDARALAAALRPILEAPRPPAA